jgi:hypothetical protein
MGQGVAVISERIRLWESCLKVAAMGLGRMGSAARLPQVQNHVLFAR